MDCLRSTPVEPRSYFARRLAADPELAARCEAVANTIRDAAAEDIQAGERSDRFGGLGVKIIINARAD